MSVSYAVGIKIGRKADQMTVEAEDALIAALKVTRALTPRPLSRYVRKQNARGDRRHPHASQIEAKPAEPVADPKAPARFAAQSAG